MLNNIINLESGDVIIVVTKFSTTNKTLIDTSSLNTDSNGSKYARCNSCLKHPCDQTEIHITSICQDYQTELTYETKNDNKEPQIRFNCKKNRAITDWFLLNSEDTTRTIEFQAAKQLQCRVKDVVFIKSEAENNIRKLQEKYGPIGFPQIEHNLCQLSVNPNIEGFIVKEIHRTVSHHDNHGMYSALCPVVDETVFHLVKRI